MTIRPRRGGYQVIVYAGIDPVTGRQRRKERFARLIMRHGRVLGGPAVRAACGGNLKRGLVATQGGMAGSRP